MAAKGPVPKRADRRLGHRSKADAAAVSHSPAGRNVVVPEPDKNWHPMARDWFVSLRESGQHAWYESSDWATAVVWAEVLSRQLASEKPSAVMVQAWASAAGELLSTEGARRRVRLELDRTPTSDADQEAADAAVNVLYAQFGEPPAN
jgi:hypothetical protein